MSTIHLKRLFSFALACAVWFADVGGADATECSNDAASGKMSGNLACSQIEYKAGYSTRPRFGGPNSPEGQLEDNDRVTKPAFRFPAIDNFFGPWREWKRRLNEDDGFQITGHYATLAQKLDRSLTDEDTGSSGVFRITTKWTLIGRDTPNTGSIVLMVDNRHAFRDLAPAGVASQAGYIGVTGTLFSDVDWVIPNLNWQQSLNDGDSGLLIGRYDPNDYMNILGYTNPWTTFQNVAILLEPSVAFPDSGWGAAAGHWFSDQWYALAGFNDANGKVTDDLNFFDGGSEFFTWAHVGWSPSKDQRYFKNAHLMVWHVDDREDAGIPSAEGVAVAVNWTFDERWMPFVRAGWSEGAAPIYNKSATLGLIRQFVRRSDLVGLAVNWGRPPDGSLRDQTTIEAFWRFQFSQNLAITPSLQFLADPALNPDEDKVWVYSLRARLTF
ncbi:carbohydrate porin [Gammaproteobacteria bacterium]|nr:carbohydrate porin [Gammaproteobacteria bacterium]